LLVDKGLAPSRQRARALIMAGKILVNGLPAAKAGTLVSEDDRIELKGGDMPYVSRGGLKLEGALKELNLTIADCTCLDVGASTGGFTDCLLQNGAARVYAVDVGYGQLAWKLRQDSRVVAIERTNIRHMPFEMIPWMKAEGIVLALIKPQFEVGKNQVGKGGVVRDPKLHERVIEDLSSFFSESGYLCGNVIPSPILGPKGNREFFILLHPNPDKPELKIED